ncbi:hypothetical protein CFAEC_04930 [Corynebacterium faecale]|uniref:NUDIX hydrolase n=1 Tax=Corynebacterium faecale TaxID=1758466 RepID=UPI0025B48404|nr:NUDIX domain-containing protein [Corynebacterium faecale]WJY91832.1 hypothetical protein CFAEC_04930 [Corynebacterium faecale]
MTLTIRIAAVVFRNHDGDVLSVRKAGTDSFMMPGGKVEPGEHPLSTAVREIAEELHLTLDPSRLEHLGRFIAPAANESGFTVDCDVFIWPNVLSELPQVFDEIAEACWVPVNSHAPWVAPLSRDVIFPRLRTAEAEAAGSR